MQCIIHGVTCYMSGERRKVSVYRTWRDGRMSALLYARFIVMKLMFLRGALFCGGRGRQADERM